MADDFNIDDLFGEEDDVQDDGGAFGTEGLFDDDDDADAGDDAGDFSFEALDAAEDVPEREPVYDTFETTAFSFKKYQGMRPRLSSLFTPAALPKK